MSKFITKFQNNAAYEAAESNLILPSVSYSVQENEVHFKPFVDPSGGHPYVEIGGIKWATMNVGANSITDYGLYFQWGDTQGYTAAQVGSGEGKKYFGWEDYKYGNGASSQTSEDMTKYQGAGDGKDGLLTLEASDDAVTAAWGGNWRVPTENEMKALTAATTNELVTNYQGSGIDGRLLTDKNDSSKVLFFPFCGSPYKGKISYAGQTGSYWCNSVLAENVTQADVLAVYPTGSAAVSTGRTNRFSGLSIRGVLGE